MVFKFHVSLFLISIFLTVLVLLVNRLAVNRKLMKEIKERITEIRENLTKAQKEGNAEDTNKFFSELMKNYNQYLKLNFKALIISLAIIAIFFPWMKYKYEGLTIANLPFSLPVIGSSLNWIMWYILVSFAIGWVIKKLFGE